MVSAGPGTGPVAVSWTDTPTGRLRGSRVLDLDERGWVIDLATDIRGRLGAEGIRPPV